MLDGIWIWSHELIELIECSWIQSISHLIDFVLTSGPSSRSWTSGFWLISKFLTDYIAWDSFLTDFEDCCTSQATWLISIPEAAVWLILKIAGHLKYIWLISMPEAAVWLILKIAGHLKQLWTISLPWAVSLRDFEDFAADSSNPDRFYYLRQSSDCFWRFAAHPKQLLTDSLPWAVSLRDFEDLLQIQADLIETLS